MIPPVLVDDGVAANYLQEVQADQGKEQRLKEEPDKVAAGSAAVFLLQ